MASRTTTQRGVNSSNALRSRKSETFTSKWTARACSSISQAVDLFRWSGEKIAPRLFGAYSFGRERSVAPHFHLPSARQARKPSARNFVELDPGERHAFPSYNFTSSALLPRRDSRSGRSVISSSSYIPVMYVPRAARGVASLKATLQRTRRPRYVHYTRVPNV